jgi:hypothetical protein
MFLPSSAKDFVPDAVVLRTPTFSIGPLDTFALWARGNVDPLVQRVLSHRGTFDGSRSGLAGELKIPSPIRAATIWIRAGGTWRAAFHGQDPIFDAKNPLLPVKAEGKKETRRDGKAAPSANIAADPDGPAAKQRAARRKPDYQFPKASIVVLR